MYVPFLHLKQDSSFIASVSPDSIWKNAKTPVVISSFLWNLLTVYVKSSI